MSGATLVRFLENDLLNRMQVWEDELLTMREAASESGLNYNTIQHKIGDGSITNVGKPGKPRVRRGDLPKRKAEADGDLPDYRSGDFADLDIVDEILSSFESGAE